MCLRYIRRVGRFDKAEALACSIQPLVVAGTLSEECAIIGVARREWTQEFFRQQLREAITSFATQKVDPVLWAKCEERIYYCQGSFDDPKTYEKLKTLLSDLEAKHRTGGNTLVYLSVQPISVATIATQLRANGLVTETATAWRRLIVEKPFGHDLASARELNATLVAALPEKQIYRIDHYLGKETAQNLLVLVPRHFQWLGYEGRGSLPATK